MGTEEKQERLGIEREIHEWRFWIVVFALALLISYFVYFHLYLGIPASKEAGSWAEFGDFFGGILNPLVAFAAFYWLTQSVKLQKTELAETRKALEGAEAAQKIQAGNSDQNIRLSSRAALVNAIQLQITARQQEIGDVRVQKDKQIELLAKESFVVREFLKWQNSGSNQQFDNYSNANSQIDKVTSQLVEKIKKLEMEIYHLEQERDKYLGELREIVILNSYNKEEI